MSKSIRMATWDDVPHLDETAKKELYDSYPPHMRDARTKGVPQLGSGAIYPVSEDKFTVEPFAIPAYWPRAYALDVGWNRTAALWGAWDQQSDVVYAYSEYYEGHEKPEVHAKGIKQRGDWIPGVIDPAARGRGQDDGKKLVDQYIAENLNLFYADNAVETGLLEVWQRISSGRFKLFRTCSNFLFEYRIYRRDEKGQIVKSHDHLMDCVRYLCMSGLAIATFEERARMDANPQDYDFEDDGGDSVTGY